MDNTWKDEISRTILNLFRAYKGTDVRKLPFPEELYERNFCSALCIGLMQKYPPIFKKMFLNDVALLWMRGFHAYDTASVS